MNVWLVFILGWAPRTWGIGSGRLTRPGPAVMGRWSPAAFSRPGHILYARIPSPISRSSIGGHGAYGIFVAPPLLPVWRGRRDGRSAGPHFAAAVTGPWRALISHGGRIGPVLRSP